MSIYDTNKIYIYKFMVLIIIKIKAAFSPKKNTFFEISPQN